MNAHIERGLIACCILLLTACAGSKPQVDGSERFAGSSWRLVQFVGGDDTKVSPDDRSKYTLAFVSENEVAVRFDCNRGRATWASAEPSLIEFGQLAMTRAMCTDPSLHDRLVKQWPYIRSYVLKDDHLFLSLMADGGVYEFEPSAATP